MSNGSTRIIEAEMYDGKIAKGRKGLAAQLGREFSPERIARTRPEQFKKKKAKR
jgi:hypothetical protein